MKNAKMCSADWKAGMLIRLKSQGYEQSVYLQKVGVGEYTEFATGTVCIVTEANVGHKLKVLIGDIRYYVSRIEAELIQ